MVDVDCWLISGVLLFSPIFVPISVQIVQILNWIKILFLANEDLISASADSATDSNAEHEYFRITGGFGACVVVPGQPGALKQASIGQFWPPSVTG